MTLLLGRLGLYPMPLCVLPYRHLNYCGVTHSELCRNRVHECATGSREPRRHSSRFGFFHLLLAASSSSWHVGYRGIRNLGPMLSDCLTEQIDNLRVHATAFLLCQFLQCVPQIGGKSDTHAHFFCLHGGYEVTAFCIYCTRLKTVIKCIHKMWTQNVSVSYHEGKLTSENNDRCRVLSPVSQPDTRAEALSRCRDSEAFEQVRFCVVTGQSHDANGGWCSNARDPQGVSWPFPPAPSSRPTG